MRVTVLGCGSSTGTPTLGPEGWGPCDPGNPRNWRRRPSIIVESATTRILVDTSPDLRVQLLDAGVWKVDAIIYTHAHADHVNGIDDIRSLNYHAEGPIDAYADPQTMEIIRDRFAYIFVPYGDKKPEFWRPCLTPHVIDGPFRIGDICVQSYPQEHGRMPSLGLRFGNFAYSTDVKVIPEEGFEMLAGIDTWIVDSLRETPHPTHSDFRNTLGWIERLRPRQTYLTHISHLVDYEALRAKCPDGVLPAHDGLVIDIPD